MKRLTNQELITYLGIDNSFVNPFNFGADDFFALDALTRSIKPGKALEIGTCKGYSSSIIAKNCRHLLTVDIHPNRSYTINKMQSNELPSIDEIGMYSFDNNNISQLLTDSSNLESIIETEFDFVFIDGSHDYQHVKEDTEFAISHINNHGIICWHDYSNVDDVTRYLDDLKLGYGFSDIIHCGQWCAFTKVDC